jgi:hypothetical protein
MAAILLGQNKGSRPRTPKQQKPASQMISGAVGAPPIMNFTFSNCLVAVIERPELQSQDNRCSGVSRPLFRYFLSLLG